MKTENKSAVTEALEMIELNLKQFPNAFLALNGTWGECIKALEKQIPKKPVNYDSVPHSRCPVCKNAVKVFKDAHEYHYCLYCGQALDWSDTK